MYNSDDSKKKMENRKLVLGSVALVVILLLAILLGTLFGKNAQNDGNAQNEDENSGLVFPDMGTLGDSMGPSILEAMTNNVRTVVEMADGDDGGDSSLRADIDATSLIEEIYFPYTTYSMLFRISDGRYYGVNVALDKGKYCGVLVRKTSPSLEQPYLYITIFDVNQNQDSVIKGLMNWAKSIYPSGFIVTTDNRNY